MEPLIMLIDGPNVIHTCSPKPTALKVPGPPLPDQVGLVCDEVCFYHMAGNRQVVFMEQEADHFTHPCIGIRFAQLNHCPTNSLGGMALLASSEQPQLFPNLNGLCLSNSILVSIKMFLQCCDNLPII
ncbi:hypothetical protein BS17DRAFT_790110 [Gyrodon lividus]|nr:hypothetical protein BS17DRAFT_790110 [Gyrodon lividus]